MNPALYESVTAELICGNWSFKASGSRLLFDGFKRVYDDKEEGEEEGVLPPLQEGEILKPLDIKLEQHWTKPPPRYNESSLIKELEEKGIGRPSTYATIISTLKKRGYVKVQDGRFYPTTLGNVVCELLLQHFTDIMDTGFTAKMERELDLVERGEEEWRRTVSNFYSLLKGYLEKAEKEIEVLKGKGIKTDLKCPLCGGDVVIKIGKNGEFIACRNYPQCSFTSNFKRETDGKIVLLSGEKIDGKCPQCGSPLLVKWTKRGQRFIACSSYPSCKWTSPYKTGEKCPSCGADLVERISKRGKIFTGCERYPECKFIKKSSK
jgi:DNA topoisomerase-1